MNATEIHQNKMKINVIGKVSNKNFILLFEEQKKSGLLYWKPDSNL